MLTASLKKAYILTLLSVIIWGIAAPVGKYTLQSFTPYTFLTYRFFITALIAIPFMPQFIRSFTKKGGNLVYLTIHAALGTSVSLGFLFLGLEKTSVLALSLMSVGTPILVELAASIFLNEKITQKEKLGSTIALSGAFLTIIYPQLVSQTSSNASAIGNLFIMAHIFTDTAAMLMLKKIVDKKNVDSRGLSLFTFLVGAITFIPFAITKVPTEKMITEIISATLPYHLGVFYMIIFSGIAAYWFRAMAFKYAEASRLSLFGYITPLISATIGLVFLKEPFTTELLIGGSIIAVGVFIAERPEKKTRKR